MNSGKARYSCFLVCLSVLLGFSWTAQGADLPVNRKALPKGVPVNPALIPKPAGAAPASVTATAVSPTSVRVTWAPLAGASDYTVWRGPSPTGVFQTIGTVAAAGPWQMDAGQLSNSTMYYKVVANYPAMNPGASAVVGATTPPVGMTPSGPYMGNESNPSRTSMTIAPPTAQPTQATAQPAGTKLPLEGGKIPQKGIPVTVAATPPSPPILIGTGISDITGPIAEVGMMGYANISQVASGLHTRLYARAFVFANPNSNKRVVLVTAELGQLFSSLKQGVIRNLKQRYGTLYDDSNVMISATHTHAGPGGYSHHAMFNFTTFGFVQQNYNAIVEGITQAIVQADRSMATATLRVATNDMVAGSASVNRSPVAYRLNPEAKPQAVPRLPEVNLEMLLLRVDRPTTGPAGVIAWFSVHNTSLSKNNLLVGSDHKGYAAYLFEKKQGTIAPLQQPGKFVAAFPNGDEGDVSPNIQPGFTRPGRDEFDAVRIIGEREFNNADYLFTNVAKETVTGPLEYRHMFVPMSGLDVPGTTYVNGASEKKLCRAAYGFSFAAGAEDGPSGFPYFTEGMTFSQQSAAGWAGLRNSFSNSALVPASVRTAFQKGANDFDDACQRPKPILVPSGSWQLTPDILPFQLLRVGTLAIAAVPSEMTTQAGRRLRARILAALRPRGVTRVVITGLANEYSGYVSTPEEYASQQYEGASTLYGPLTLEGYLKVFGQLADAMAGNQDVPIGPTPPDLSANQISLQTSVLFDSSGLEKFGQVLNQPPAYVTLSNSAQPTVQAAFRAGHPKNDLRTNDTYLLVERKVGKSWLKVAWDSMPETRLTWGRADPLCPACSTATVRWDVPLNSTPGTYRIRHFGSWKNARGGAITPYEGVTNTFEVYSSPPATGAITPCGAAGERACCAPERPFSPCNAGLHEEGKCVGPTCTCGGANPGGLLKSIGLCVATPPPPQITSCGGEGERACCAAERVVATCNQGLHEEGNCVGPNCTCGGPNPGGLLKSIGLCARDTHCGGLGERACCMVERAGSPCDSGLHEEGNCVGPNCTCGGANPGGLLKSISHCAAPTHCGAEGERACCLTERTSPCDQGFNQVVGCTTGNCTCGGDNPGGVLNSIGHCARN
jgi:neutral ceramidase